MIAAHSELTHLEMRALCDTRSAQAMLVSLYTLRDMGLVVSYRWERRRRPDDRRRRVLHDPHEKRWSLNRSHPWIWEIRAFARALAVEIDVPGQAKIGLKKRRQYRGPGLILGHNKAKSPVAKGSPKVIFPICRGTGMTRILMLLAHQGYYSRGMPLGRMTRLLGLSMYGALRSVNALEGWGVVRSTWMGRERFVRHNEKYRPWNSLKLLLLRIDTDTGSSYGALARLHHQRAFMAAIRVVWKKARRRRAQRAARKKR